ncbi:MAG: YfiR family protein, partial [Pseudomonadota bacterium]
GDSIDGLNVLFVGQSQTRTSEPLLRSALSHATLTVTEAPAQRPDGSVINFAIIDDRVRFDVSLAMAEQAGLTISSRLLQVARRVIEPTP